MTVPALVTPVGVIRSRGYRLMLVASNQVPGCPWGKAGKALWI